MCDLDKSCQAFVATSNVLWSGKLPLAVMFCFVVFQANCVTFDSRIDGVAASHSAWGYNAIATPLIKRKQCWTTLILLPWP